MLHLIFEIDPGLLRINRAFRSGKTWGGKPITYKGVKYASAQSMIAEFVHLLDVRFSGAVEMSVTSYWGETLGDIDAPVKGLLDALQAGGLLEDDKQVVRCDLRRLQDVHNPRIEVEIHETT